MRLSAGWCLCVFAAALPMAIGCGTSALEARMNSATERLQKQMKYRDLDPAERSTQIATIPGPGGTGVKIQFRKPAFLNVPPLTEGAMDPNNPSMPLPPGRLKPPFLQAFPGFRFCYEKYDKQPTGLVISYLYVGAQPADPLAGDHILTQLQAAFPDVENIAWKHASYDTPEGGRIDWKTVTVTHDQDFWFIGNNAASQLPATFVMMMHENQGVQVFLAWRYMNKSPNPEKFAGLIPAAAGTVTMQSGVPIQ